MLADFLAVTPQTPSLVVTTYRPEYRGELTRLPRSQTIALAPLDNSQTTSLTAELLGRIRRSADWRPASQAGPRATRSSPKKSCVTSPSAASSTVDAAVVAHGDIADITVPSTCTPRSPRA